MLVTLYGNYNYGNVLQRCALAKIIEALGFQVTHLFGTSAVFSSARNFFKFIVLKYYRIFKLILACFGIKKFQKRFAFADFQARYASRQILIPIDRVLTSPSSRWNVYDYAVAGSDQVWNLFRHTENEARYYYLSFIPREKRICYAPSFGFSKFYESDIEFHKKGLAGFERISCREQEMIPMIKSISGKDSQLVLDPTLLLDVSQWRRYAEKPKYEVPEKYVFCYFLGSKPREYMTAIHETAGDLSVVSIDDQDDKEHHLTYPGGFLWLIDHADFVCTDSFHGTAFSVNFGKNFLAFRRKQTGAEDMFGRISGLLDSLNITGHIYEHGMKIRPDPVNYDEVYSRLAALRESSMHYLKDCLHVN